MSFTPQEYQRALRRRGMGAAPGDALRAQADLLDSLEPGTGGLLRTQAAQLDAAGAVPAAAPSRPLSTGAKVGIGIAGAGILAAALWPKKRRRRRR